MPSHNEYRAQWVRAGYPSQMGSAEVVPPPPQKFLRVYHFTSQEYALSAIALRRLKIARFADLNDPFELLSLNLREKKTRNATRNFKDSYGEKIGLLCFSANWTNPLLWSHYAAKHTGISLGFNVMRAKLEQVSYEDDRILNRLDRNKDPTLLPEALQADLFRTKSNH